MTNAMTPITQLVTRIPRGLRRRVKMHCLMRETTLTQFVIDAISERLATRKTLRQIDTPRAAAR